MVRLFLFLSILILPAFSTAPHQEPCTYGNPAAKVKIEMYYSLTCSHCADWEGSVWPEIRAKYVDTGKVYFIFNDYPTDPLGVDVTKLARVRGTDFYRRILPVLLKRQSEWLAVEEPLKVVKSIIKEHDKGITEADFDEALKKHGSLDIYVHEKIKEAFNKDKIGYVPAFKVKGKLIEDVLTPGMIEKAIPAEKKTTSSKR